MEWDIRREGRAWTGDEGLERYALEKFEMIEGRLLWSDTDRVNLLALLLENVGADRAVRLGNPSVWMEAVAGLAEEAIGVGQANTARLRYLSSKCGGWIVWADTGPRYVPLEECRARYDEWFAGRGSF